LKIVHKITVFYCLRHRVQN